MTPQDALDRAMQMLMSPEFEPIIGQALANAADIGTAAATLVYPIIYRLQQETDLPDEELFGTEEGDGIAIYLLQEVFDIAGDAGFMPEDGNEEFARAEAEKAVQVLANLLDQSSQAERQALPANPQAPAPQAPQGLMTEGQP